MASKLKKCKSCGAEIAKSAKTCPSCGAKNKKPFYTKVWFWVIIVFFLIIAISAGSSNNETPNNTPNQGTSETSNSNTTGTEPTISYTAYSVNEMMKLLNENALKAKQTYNDQYVEITGRLSVIDSNGSYIALFPTDDDFAFVGVQCFIQNEDQLNTVANLAIDDQITVRGRITDVGEVLGYWLDIDEIIK